MYSIWVRGPGQEKFIRYRGASQPGAGSWGNWVQEQQYIVGTEVFIAAENGAYLYKVEPVQPRTRAVRLKAQVAA